MTRYNQTNEMETKKSRARERTTSDARSSARNGLDPKLLSVNERLDSKDVGVERNVE